MNELVKKVSISQIYELENYLVKMPQLEVPIKHTFADGLYLREGLIPAGACFTGNIHKTEHIVIIVSGDISVVMDGKMERLKGPTVLVSKPGAKRAGFAHEDTLWINVHHNPTNERDVDKIDTLFVTADPTYLLENV